ncbi:HepT-like ribonuclease domain-containing protein [Salinigranum halophilum]|uniref:HepT-like ribonuclease domain-containing protein n=1 Tax=Salinigranum halophilum TaxID=2565931 RepID=UPI00191C092F
MHEEGVINEQTMTTIVSAIGFRNVLAHEYGHIDAVNVYETLQTGRSVYDTYS